MSLARKAIENATPWRVFGFVTIPVLVVYLATASWTLPYHIDTVTNVFTAWEIGTDGDVILEDHEVLVAPEYVRTIAWIVPAGDSVAAQYPPGAPALAAPLYAVWPQDASYVAIYNEATELAPVDVLMPPLGPAAITAASVSALVAGLLAVALLRLVDPRTAVIAAYVAAFGTGLWSVAADSLWQHGPAMLWITAGMLLSVDHRLWAGFAYGVAVITRPHTAVVAAANGLTQAYQARSLKPVVQIGVGSGLGLLGLVMFNSVVFGGASVSGGYAGTFATNAASPDLFDWARNTFLAMLDPVRGLLVYSPFLLFLLPGIPAAWRRAPSWVRGSALGGLVYILLQLKANRFSGGDTFWGYRYPLEMLAATAPLLVLAYTEWVKNQSAMLRRLFRYALLASIALTAVGSVAY